MAESRLINSRSHAATSLLAMADGDERGVDPLSLFLSLERSDDERIQQQLLKMMAKVRST